MQMKQTTIVDTLRAHRVPYGVEEFDNLMIPPMHCYLHPQDVMYLNKVITSHKYRLEEKYKMINELMRARGFVKFTSGTNRVVYRYLEDQRFVAKIALDRVGIHDNHAELRNQNYLKPFVAKMFYVSPCGTVGFAERVLPITKRMEFEQVAGEVFMSILAPMLLQGLVADDIGTDFFMNFGIRLSVGPVLLDYPYIYPLDPKKMYCTKIDLDTGIPCNGEIDYDDGFNTLCCTKCGKKYRSIELKLDKTNNDILNHTGGGIPLKVKVIRGEDESLVPVESECVAPKRIGRRKNRLTDPSQMKVIVVRGEEPKRGPDGKLILDDTPAEQDKPKRSHHKKKEPVKEEEVEKVEAEEVEVSEVTEKVKFTTGSNFINGDY